MVIDRGECGKRPDTVGQPPRTEIGVPNMPSLNPRSRSQVEPCDFCAYVPKITQKEVLLLDWELRGRQECPHEDRNVAAIVLNMPCRVSGDHPFLAFFTKIPLQFVSPLERGFEGKKAEKTAPRKSTLRTLKEVGQQYPPDIETRRRVYDYRYRSVRKAVPSAAYR